MFFLFFFPFYWDLRVTLFAVQCDWKSLDFCHLTINKRLGQLISWRTQDYAGPTGPTLCRRLGIIKA